jgi:hypothetical protein
MLWVLLVGLFGGVCAVFAVRAFESDDQEEVSPSDEIEIIE